MSTVREANNLLRGALSVEKVSRLRRVNTRNQVFSCKCQSEDGNVQDAFLKKHGEGSFISPEHDPFPRSEVDALVQAAGEGVPELYRWDDDENGRLKFILTQDVGRDNLDHFLSERQLLNKWLPGETGLYESILFQVLNVLQRNHAKGVFHFDVSSRNIMISGFDPKGSICKPSHVYVVDYGCAQVARRAMLEGARYTARAEDAWVVPPMFGSLDVDPLMEVLRGIAVNAGDKRMNGVLNDRYEWGKLAMKLFNGSNLSVRPKHMPPDLFDLVERMTTLDATRRLCVDARLSDHPWMKKCADSLALEIAKETLGPFVPGASPPMDVNTLPTVWNKRMQGKTRALYASLQPTSPMHLFSMLLDKASGAPHVADAGAASEPSVAEGSESMLPETVRAAPMETWESTERNDRVGAVLRGVGTMDPVAKGVSVGAVSEDGAMGAVLKQALKDGVWRGGGTSAVSKGDSMGAVLNGHSTGAVFQEGARGPVFRSDAMRAVLNGFGVGQTHGGMYHSGDDVTSSIPDGFSKGNGKGREEVARVRDYLPLEEQGGAGGVVGEGGGSGSTPQVVDSGEPQVDGGIDRGVEETVHANAGDSQSGVEVASTKKGPETDEPMGASVSTVVEARNLHGEGEQEAPRKKRSRTLTLLLEEAAAMGAASCEDSVASESSARGKRRRKRMEVSSTSGAAAKKGSRGPARARGNLGTGTTTASASSSSRSAGKRTRSEDGVEGHGTGSGDSASTMKRVRQEGVGGVSGMVGETSMGASAVGAAPSEIFAGGATGSGEDVLMWDGAAEIAASSGEAIGGDGGSGGCSQDGGGAEIEGSRAIATPVSPSSR